MINDEPHTPLIIDWIHAYEYYRGGGMTSYIVQNVCNIIMGILISLTPIFFFGCIDFSQITVGGNLSDVILPFKEGWERSGFIIKVCSFVFLLFVITNIIQFLYSIPRHLRMRKLFNDYLNIDDYNIKFTKWDDIVGLVLKINQDRTTRYIQIASQICAYDNRINTLISGPDLLTWTPFYADAPCRIPMTNMFLYLFKVSLRGLVLDKKGNPILPEQANIRTNEISIALEKRFKRLGIVLFILSPFVFVFQALYLVFLYVQAIRSSPEPLTRRRWTKQAQWLFREINELPHVFEERLDMSYFFANELMDMFPNEVLQILARWGSYVSGAGIATIFIVGLRLDINKIFIASLGGGKTISWLLAIFVTVYAACRGLISKKPRSYNHEEMMQQLERFTHFDFRDSNHLSNTPAVYDKLSELFQPVWMQLLLELGGCILNPVLFYFILPEKADTIVKSLQRKPERRNTLGSLSSLSFDERERVTPPATEADSSGAQLWSSIFSAPPLETPPPVGNQNFSGFFEKVDSDSEKNNSGDENGMRTAVKPSSISDLNEPVMPWDAPLPFQPRNSEDIYDPNDGLVTRVLSPVPGEAYSFDAPKENNDFFSGF